MSKKVQYYTCEWDDIDHDFKTVKLKVYRTLYPQAQVCKRCGSIFDFGNLGVDIRRVVDQMSGVDLSQFKLEEATRANQAVLSATRWAKISRPTSKSRANLKRLTDTMLTEEEETKAIPPRSIWRMDSK